MSYTFVSGLFLGSLYVCLNNTRHIVCCSNVLVQCCSWGEGSYSITLNGEKVISSDDSNFVVKDHQFAIKEEEIFESQVKTLYVFRHADVSSGALTLKSQ